MFLPTTKEEMQKLGWDAPEIILVTGDTYIDSPYIGVAAIGKYLSSKGYKVAIIAQPDIDSEKDITRLGAPALFWGVSAGSVDSMVANYTPLKKKRKSDDFTPGGINNRRPDRASIVYTNLVRRYFKDALIVLGGIEASLRRLTHFDYWSNRLRRPVIFDAKADYLIYGMAEKTVNEFAHAIKQNEDPRTIRGLGYIASEAPEKSEELPSFESCVEDSKKFAGMYKTFYENNDGKTAKGLHQKVGERYLVLNPPALPASEEEIDSFYDLSFERETHPYYAKEGKVTALDTIRFSVTTHRGCYGECHFCAITVHQGRTIASRSEKSVLDEVRSMAKHPKFRGIISDLGGPTANMYGFECTKKLKSGPCFDQKCIYPDVCRTLKPDHSAAIRLLQKVSEAQGVKKVFVTSGIRFDLIAADESSGEKYIRSLAFHHTSGQLKTAPEHVKSAVLHSMGKPGIESLLDFKKKFEFYSSKAGKKQYLTYYFIAAHPGCTLQDMGAVKNLAQKRLNISPEQVQIFTPTPSTYSTLMYYTEKDLNGKRIFVEKDLRAKEKQKNILTQKPRNNALRT